MDRGRHGHRWYADHLGSGASDVWAAGCEGALVHFDGKTPTPHLSGTSARLNGVFGSSASDVLVVGNSGTMLRYDGTKWRAAPEGLRSIASGRYTCPDLRDVTVTSKGDWYVVGSQETILSRCAGGKCP